MKKPTYNPLDIYEGLQDVIESDFNPDIVELFGIDMWDSGYKYGVKWGMTVTAITLGGICIVHKVYTDIKQLLEAKSNTKDS